MKNGQNDEKDWWHHGCCYFHFLGRLAVKHSLHQECSWEGPWQYSRCKDQGCHPFTGLFAGAMPQPTLGPSAQEIKCRWRCQDNQPPMHPIHWILHPSNLFLCWKVKLELTGLLLSIQTGMGSCKPLSKISSQMSFGGGMSTVIWLSDQQKLREENPCLFI